MLELLKHSRGQNIHTKRLIYNIKKIRAVLKKLLNNSKLPHTRNQQGCKSCKKILKNALDVGR